MLDFYARRSRRNLGTDCEGSDSADTGHSGNDFGVEHDSEAGDDEDERFLSFSTPPPRKGSVNLKDEKVSEL